MERDACGTVEERRESYAHLAGGGGVGVDRIDSNILVTKTKIKISILITWYNHY